MQTEITIEVRSTEIDVLGHVNNAKYLEYLEWGREDWYNKIGMPFSLFAELMIGTVTASIHINYRREALLGQRLTITTSPVRKGRSSFVLQQLIHNGDGELVAEAEVISVTIDMNVRKSVPMPESLAVHFV